MISQVTLYLRLNGWRMDRCWRLTVTIRFCLMAAFSKSLGARWLTLADTAAWHLTVQGSAAATTTSMFWVQQLYLITAVIHFRMILTSLTLLVPVSPTIAGSGPEGSVEEVTVTVSSPTSLLCEAQSYPPALITWLRDGSPFESGHNVRVLPGVTLGMTVKMSEGIRSLVYGCHRFITPASTGGRTLQILKAKEEDAGRYTCMATNEAGETLKHYEVKVFGESPFSL